MASRQRKRAAKEISASDDEFEDVPEELLDDGDEPQEAVLQSLLGALEGAGQAEGGGLGRDFSRLPLKRGHEARPLWVCPDGHIFLEAFSPFYQRAYDFLVAIAEPVSRPELLHEYRLTQHSLYAAVSVGLTAEGIITWLDRFSKVPVSSVIQQFIEHCTRSYGRVKVVLKRNTYYMESPDEEVLRKLLDSPVVAAARRATEGVVGTFEVTEAPVERSAASIMQDLASTGLADVVERLEPELMLEEGEEAAAATGPAAVAARNVYSFRIEGTAVEAVRRAALEIGLPAQAEYEFKAAEGDPAGRLAIALKPATRSTIRSYQQTALSKVFGNGRARSGIVVLPCGAGKTLVGITAIATLKRSALVVCTTAVAVQQWREQFLLWTNVEPARVARFTASDKDPIPDTGIVISTYSMLGYSGQRAADSDLPMEIIKTREWGMLVLDEVHVAPARMFRKVISVTKSHCKLGLTATLVREDGLISDLNFLIGPKLYEANWMDLTQMGFLARVQCVEVWCPMTAAFYREYLRMKDLPKRRLLYAMNPNKFQACHNLIRYHEARGDKVLVFSDHVFPLVTFAELLKRPHIYGKTPNEQREAILAAFQRDPSVNTIFISKVGDNSIDLPAATVIVQLSSHFGSRRQEAQRLGRVLRPKFNRTGPGFHAYFYSLVSTETQEMMYSHKRQQYLVDQGYAFKILNAADLDWKSFPQTVYVTEAEQRELLTLTLEADDSAEREERASLREEAGAVARTSQQAQPAKRRQGALAVLSGGGGATYAEFSSGRK